MMPAPSQSPATTTTTITTITTTTTTTATTTPPTTTTTATPAAGDSALDTAEGGALDAPDGASDAAGGGSAMITTADGVLNTDDGGGSVNTLVLDDAEVGDADDASDTASGVDADLMLISATRHALHVGAAAAFVHLFSPLLPMLRCTVSGCGGGGCLTTVQQQLLRDMMLPLQDLKLRGSKPSTWDSLATQKMLRVSTLWGSSLLTRDRLVIMMLRDSKLGLDATGLDCAECCRTRRRCGT
jgi:hypothetical protein